MPEFSNPYSYLAANAERAGNELAVVSIEEEITWAELQFDVDRISSKLRFEGVGPGQIVTLLGENIFLWKIQLALFKLGAVPCVVSTPMIPDYLENELLIIDRAGKTSARLSIVIDDMWMKDARDRFKPVAVEAGYQPEDAFRLILTSGTTGTPKAPLIPYRNFLARIESDATNWDFPRPEFSLMGFSAAVGFWAAIRALVNGDVFISITGSGKKVADIISKYKVKSLIGSPAQLQGESEFWQDADPRLSTLEKVMSTGAATNHQLVALLKKKFDAKIFTRFGSTEAGGVSERELGDPSADPKWIGHLNPGSDVKIVDDQGNAVEQGVVGNLLARSVAMASGYWKNPVETAKRFKDGWFVTGDLAQKTADGKIVLHARDSELINMGGVKLDPDRVDLVLATHPSVIESGTFAFTRKNGQVIAVSMVRVTSSDKLKEITDFMRARLGVNSSKVILPVEKIPHNANGKLDRNKLSQMYSARLEQFFAKHDARQ